MGVLDYMPDLCYYPRNHRKLKKKKQLQTVEIKVRIDCEGCERKVRKAVKDMKGVSTVDVDPKLNKLTVTGLVDPNKVLRRVQWKTGKKAELWPYVPYDVVAHPYAPGAYDKKAPPGYVRNVVDDPAVGPLARASSTEEWLAVNLHDTTTTWHQLPWNVLFAMLLWGLWKERYNRLFDSTRPSIGRGKLNVDASRLSDGRCSIGGVFRDPHGIQILL